MTSEAQEVALQDRFLEWCKSNRLRLSDKVTMSCDGCCHRFGLLATSHISEGDVLFQVPRQLLLNPSNSKMTEHIQRYDEEHGTDIMDGSPSGWVPLLLTLMHEVSQGDQSEWAPYLDLIPARADMNQPYLWPPGEIDTLLTGLLLKKDLLNDMASIQSEYTTYAQPFLSANKELFRTECTGLDFYTHLACFVMAYSFTEEEEGVSMVPMADILNHHSNNNAHLEFGKNHLAMVATRDITAGDEIFNTFGQISNNQLLQMYGYVEKDNPFNKVAIELERCMSHSSQTAECFVPFKWNYLERKMHLEPGDRIEITHDKFTDGKEIIAALQVISFNDDELITFLSDNCKKCRLSAKLLDEISASPSSSSDSRVKPEQVGDKRHIQHDNGKEAKLKCKDQHDTDEIQDTDDEESSDDEDDEDEMTLDDFLSTAGAPSRTLLLRAMKDELMVIKKADNLPMKSSDHYQFAAQLRQEALDLLHTLIKRIEAQANE